MQIDFSKFGSILTLNNNLSWSNVELELEVFYRIKKLIDLGFKPGDKVVIAHGGSLEFFSDLFAVWCLGGCACCLNENSTEEEIVTITDFVDSKFILVDQNSRKGIALESVNITSLQGRVGYNKESIQAYIDSTTIDSDALILFTSGTTGIPKGVTHTFRGLLSRLELNWEYIPYRDRSIGLCVLPTHFGHGLIGNCLTVLMGGGDLIIYPGSEVITRGNLGSIIDKYNITFMSSVPSFWKGVLRSNKPISNSLRRVHVGSALLSEQLWNDIIDWTGVKKVVNMYGITETANWICGASSEDYNPKNGLLGKPWGGSINILDSDNNLCQTGYGELIVQTPSIMREYFKLHAESSEAIKGGWFKTGDYGEINEKGVVTLTGRKKYQINKAGIKIHPEDIDTLIECNEYVFEACSFGIDDDISGQIIGVAISPKDHSKFELDQLKKWVSHKISKDKNPDHWFVLDDIPKTDRGKINRDNVAKFCLSRVDVNLGDSDKDPAINILKESLGLNNVDKKILTRDSGNWDSLSMLRIMISLEKYLNREITSEELLLLNNYNGIKSIIDKTNLKKYDIDDKDKRSELISILKKAGYGKHQVNHLLISHLFCNNFGIKNIGLFIEDLINELPKKSTLVMSSFTWDFIQSGKFSLNKTATQLGIINEKFRRAKGVKRSLHPIYSYSSLGPLTDELFNSQTENCWDQSSVTMKLMRDYDTRVICLGLGFRDGEGLVAATGIHALEQKFKVPYRFFKKFNGEVDFGDGYRKYEAEMYVRDLDKSLRSSWTNAAKHMRKKGKVYESLNREVYAYDNKDLYTIASYLLEEDLNVFNIPK